MRKTMLFCFPLFVLALCLGAATFHTAKVAATPGVSCDSACASNLLADGSDPMPLCRNGKDIHGHACTIPVAKPEPVE